MDIHYFGTNRNFQHVKNFEDKVQDYTAFKTLSKKYLEYRNWWIKNDKWIDIIHTKYCSTPSSRWKKKR